MKVLILTDLEGVSGMVEWRHCQPLEDLREWQQELMTGEVNAAVAGAFDAGATEVKVSEGHTAIDIRLLDERATLVPAVYPALPIYQGWDEGYDAAIQIGKHAMAHTPDGVLAHSYSSKTVDWMKLNDKLIGEIGIEFIECGDYGIASVMVSGDLAACREGQKMLPDIETAPVKTGYGTNHANCLQPEAARDLIYEAAQRALNRLDTFKPCVMPGPMRLVVRHLAPYDKQWIEDNASKKWVEIIDEHTVAYTGCNAVEVLARRSNQDYTWPGN